MKAWPARSANRQSASIRLGFTTLPIVSLRDLSRAPVYNECVARLLIGGSVILSAGEFVEDFESSGVVGTLDAAIARMVVEALEGNSQVALGCNVSPYSIADRQSWDALLSVFRHNPELTSKIYLEITESLPIDEIEEVAERLAEAKRCGCKLVIDDFGAGYATSSYLHGVDIDWDVVKIDKGCFGAVGGMRAEIAALRSQLALAAALAPLVVVEGIETSRHLDIALSAGAIYGQGWLFDNQLPKKWCVIDEKMRQYCNRALISRASIGIEEQRMASPFTPY